MRLVSQNGEFDVPYETASLSRTGNIIRAYIPMVGEKGTVMAHYSTDEKAENAMKMLHNTYTGTFFSQNMHITENDEKKFLEMVSTKGLRIIRTLTNEDGMKFEQANIVFQFTEDDEV